MSSGVLILIPAEIYKYGSNLVWIIPMLYIDGLLGIYVFLPALYKSDVTTIFQYLEKRFDSKIKNIAMILYLAKQMINVAYSIFTVAIVFKKGQYNHHFISK